MKLRTLCAAVAIASFYAMGGQAQTVEPASKPLEAGTILTPVPPPPPGMGQVVFFRRSALMGFPYWTYVRENGLALGKLTNGVYFISALEPGVHEFNTSVLGKDVLKIQVDPGETYYVEGRTTMNVIGYTIIMEPSEGGSFDKVLKGMKPAKPENAAALPTDK